MTFGECEHAQIPLSACRIEKHIDNDLNATGSESEQKKWLDDSAVRYFCAQK